MDALILAGGFGTRLASVFPHLPKALVPIQGIPFLHLLLRHLARTGVISKVVIAVGYKANLIEQSLIKTAYPFEIVLSCESVPLGTGGALLHALPQLSAETLLVMNGDTYFDLDFSLFSLFHREKKAAVSLACREENDASRYGSVLFDSSQKILFFEEKKNTPQKGWINGGVYLFEREILSTFASGPSSLEKDILPRFLEKGAYAWPANGIFIDIGTPSSYEEAQHLIQLPEKQFQA